MHPRRTPAALFVLFLALCAEFFCAAAFAATIRVPQDQPTIQAGINAANNGDTVLVAPGTYYENIDFKGKAITVTSSGGAASAIIDGGNITSTVSFTNGETRSSVLEGFTIQHGQSPGISNNEGEPLGGGIYIDSSAPTILNNVITNNLCSGIYSSYGAALIQGNTISYTDNAHLGCYFSDDAPVMLYGDLQTVRTSTLISNIIGNTIENNTLQGTGTTSQSFAAGIGVLDATADVQNNIVRNNIAYGDNGGIAISGIPGPTAIGPIFVIQNLVYGNSSGCGGAGLEFGAGSSTGAGPIRAYVINNTIVNNINLPVQCNTNVSPDQGNVVTYWVTNEVAFVNNIFSSYGPAPALFCSGTPNNSDAPGPMTIFDHNDIYSSVGSTYSSGCNAEDFSYGNISADPMFLNPSAGNFQLNINSPALDAGNNSAPQLPATDIAGSPRIQDATGRGYPIVDMGAYEYSGATTVIPTMLLLTPSAYEVAGGGSLTLNVQLLSQQGPISGPIQVFSNHLLIASGNTDSNGNLTIPSATLAPGIYHFVATFAGDGSHPAATSVEAIVLADRYIPTISIMSSPNPSSLSQPVTFTVTITSIDNAVLVPVNLIDSTTSTTLAVLTPNSSGIATFTTSSLPLGSSFIDAKYAGDLTHRPIQAELRQTVINPSATTTTLTTSLDPAPPGQVVTFTATVTTASSNPVPTGTIIFSEGGTTLATQTLTAGGGGATASFSTSALSLGTHFITATYVPSGSLSASSADIAEDINDIYTATTLAASQNPANVNQSITFTATVTNTSASGAPEGYVTFYDGTTVLGVQSVVSSSANSSVATFTSNVLSAGTHAIKAIYSPFDPYLGSSAQFTETINLWPSLLSAVATPNPALFGTAVTLSATATGPMGTPTGTVTFYDGVTAIGTTLLNGSGQATTTTSTLAVGTHTLTAVYSGSSIYAPSTSAPFTEVILALPQDFSITLASPTITIQAQHHTTTSLTLASINGFADSLAISCANLPQYVTCRPTPTPASLTANGTIPVSLYLDTDSVLGYAHLIAPTRTASFKDRPAPISLALLLSPLSLLALSRKRRASLRLFALLLALLPLSLAISGCGEIIIPYDPPPFATPGTYVIPITATGATTHVSHTANLTLTITP